MLTLFIGYVLGTMPPRGSTRHFRGTVVESDLPAPSARTLRREHEGSLTLARIPVPPPDETKHFKFIGTTGTGKSTAIRELLQGALQRGDRAVIADPDAGYLKRFYDAERGDHILNPFDPRSANWDRFSEIRNPYDFEQVARSLIPDGAARTAFFATTHRPS